jgi:hypothetical protein
MRRNLTCVPRWRSSHCRAGATTKACPSASPYIHLIFNPFTHMQTYLSARTHETIMHMVGLLMCSPCSYLYGNNFTGTLPTKLGALTDVKYMQVLQISRIPQPFEFYLLLNSAITQTKPPRKQHHLANYTFSCTTLSSNYALCSAISRIMISRESRNLANSTISQITPSCKFCHLANSTFS